MPGREQTVVEPDKSPDVVFRFPRESTAPGQARRVLAQLFEPGDPIAEAVTMSASELVTNVVLHTDGGGEMRTWDPKPDVPLRLEIEDTGAGTPSVMPNQPERITGRGLGILNALADSWGTFRTSVGKVVWAEFDRNKPRPDA
jgi:anti-sigma regulatory factor (Ser/Thr protein kinase)